MRGIGCLGRIPLILLFVIGHTAARASFEFFLFALRDNWVSNLVSLGAPGPADRLEDFRLRCNSPLKAPLGTMLSDEDTFDEMHRSRTFPVAPPFEACAAFPPPFLSFALIFVFPFAVFSRRFSDGQYDSPHKPR